MMSKILEGIQKDTSKKQAGQKLGNVSATLSTQSPGFSAGLVVDGRTLEHVLHDSLQNIFLELTEKCRAVVCCRATPLQKSVLVRLVRSKLKAMTLAVGESCGYWLSSYLPVSSLLFFFFVNVCHKIYFTEDNPLNCSCLWCKIILVFCSSKFSP